jgi:hypothetical protein
MSWTRRRLTLPSDQVSLIIFGEDGLLIAEMLSDERLDHVAVAIWQLEPLEGTKSRVTRIGVLILQKCEVELGCALVSVSQKPSAKYVVM